MVVPFETPKKEKQYESVSLYEWFNTHYGEEERRNLFLNLDRAIKYLHDHGYCVMVFYPTEIDVLYDDPAYIYIKKIMRLPDDYEERRKLVQEDIFNSSFIQIGLYSNTLKYLKKDFLLDNFDSFTQFIPADDVPYYRGVFLRRAPVYFCEFAVEKRNRDLIELQKQLGELGTNNVPTLPNTNNNIDMTNSEINDQIYGYYMKKDAAFVHLLIIPTVAVVMLTIFGIISWLISILS